MKPFPDLKAPAWAILLCVFLPCAIFFTPGTAAAADTIRVVTHSDVTVGTDPSTGFRSYPRWAVFPRADFSVRKATMRVRFGCPDSMRCADWDYLDHIIVRRKGGLAGDSLGYEIGRMLTPYGGAFDHDWEFDWSTDVTDFASLLRDSVEIDYYHSGYEPNNDRGWRISVEFEFIGGPSPARAISITRIYDGNYPYGDTARPITASLAPVKFTAAAGAAFARLLVYQTGHGGDDSGCGEFCGKYREIVFDGKVVDARRIWKECGDNPLSPQAGTWIYDRANWCPGDLLTPDVYDLAVAPGSVHTVDIEMEPYVLAGTQANEAICAYLVQYSPPAAENEAALVSIVVPSTDAAGRRLNPACAGARVVVRNNGAIPLTSLYIRYGTIGFEERSFVWKGNLAFNDTALIDLPGDIPARVGGNRFRVLLLSVNDAEDVVPDDNELIVPFDATPAHRSPVVLVLKTNAEPAQTAYVVRRSDGSVARDVKVGTLAPDSLYRDTLRLDPGCYELTVTDTAGDGLEFWYNVKGGRGYVRLFDLAGMMLKNFESDFGSSIRYGFRVSDDRRIISVPVAAPAIGLFPTRTLGVTTMDYVSNAPAAVSVKIVADPGGEVIEARDYPDLQAGSFTYDLTSRGPQRYYLKVFVNGVQKFNKRVRVVEKME